MELLVRRSQQNFNTLTSIDLTRGASRVTEETTTVLEGWEMLYVRPTNEPRSRTQILGFNVKTTSVAARDGYTGVRAVPYYTQDELGRMVNEDQEAFDKSCSKCGFLRTENKPSSYTEDLTTRLFALPGCLANRLGALLDTRHSATNKSPFVRREWKVVLLRPMENPISGGSHKDQAKSPKRHFGRGRSQKNDPVQKWLIVIRGQVTMTSQDGFLTYDTSSNPWLKADELAQQRHHEKRGLPRTHP